MPDMTMLATKPESITLTKRDRCDRCGTAAQAVSVVTKGNMVLMFCGHHTDAHEPALISQGWIIEDTRAEQ